MHQLKGKSKQILGKIVKNRKLEAEGKAENLDGNGRAFRGADKCSAARIA